MRLRLVAAASGRDRLVVGRIAGRVIAGMAVLGALLGPSMAQPVSREELDGLLARVVGTNEQAVEAVLATGMGFLPGSAALLASFADAIYSNAEFQEYLLARIEEFDRAQILQSIDELAAAARADAYRKGTLRLPPSGLVAFVEHLREILLWLSATNPILCAELARDPVRVLDETDIELQYFARINPEELRQTLRYRTAAIIAESSEAPAWHSFSRAELTAGRRALAEAMQTSAPLPPPPVAACSALSVCVPPPTEEQTVCSRGLLQFEAFGSLAEPERSWAIAAYIIDLR